MKLFDTTRGEYREIPEADLWMYKHITTTAGTFRKEYVKGCGQEPEKMTITFNLPGHPSTRYEIIF